MGKDIDDIVFNKYFLDLILKSNMYLNIVTYKIWEVSKHEW